MKNILDFMSFYSEKTLVKEIKECLLHMEYGGELDYKANESAVYLSDGAKIYLTNILHEVHTLSRRERISHLREILHGFLQASSPRSYEEVAQSLLPRLRASATFYNWNLALAMDGGAPAYVLGENLCEIAENLSMEFVLDNGSTIESISQVTFKQWETSFDDLFKIAMSNLYRISDEAFDVISPGLALSRWTDNHDNARLLLIDKIQALAFGDDCIAFIPHRDLLVLADRDNSEAILKACTLVNEQLDHVRGTTSYPYRVRNGKYSLDYSHADPEVMRALKTLYLKGAISDHAEQKLALEKSLEKDGLDVFVATFSAISSDQHALSYATWSEGVTTFLPKTERIALCVESEGKMKSLGLVKWQVVMDVCAGKLQALDYTPTRFLTKGFPSQEEIRRILDGGDII